MNFYVYNISILLFLPFNIYENDIINLNLKENGDG